MKVLHGCAVAILALPLWMGDLAPSLAQPVPHVAPVPRPRVRPRPPRVAPVPKPRPPVAAPRVPAPRVVPRRVPKP